MKTLAEEIRDAMPAMIEASPRGIPLADMAARLGASMPDVRRAIGSFKARPEIGVVVVRYEGGGKRQFLRLAGIGFGSLERVCPECNLVFAVKKPSIVKRYCSMACAMKYRWRDRGYHSRMLEKVIDAGKSAASREKSRERALERFRDPAERAKVGMASRQRWADPVTRANMTAALTVSQNKPGLSEKRRRLMKERHADPESRERMYRGIRRACNSPEAKDRAARESRKRWADPAMREKMVERLRESQSAMSEHYAENLLKRWDDPAFRAMMVAAMKGKKKSKKTK